MTTAVATEEYIVVAEDEAGAREQIAKGEWEHYRDLGNDDVEIIGVERL